MIGSALAATPLAVPVLQPVGSPSSATFLLAIDRVEINRTVERDGVIHYVVDVYLQRHVNRIPTNKRLETSPDGPAFQLEKRFSEFADLRHSVWSSVQQKHEDGKCHFCDPYMSFIVTSFAQPRLIVKLGTGIHTRKRLLTRFCNEFIRLARRNHAGHRQSAMHCRGLHHSPTIVEQFFRRE